MVADGKRRKRGASLGHLRPCPSAQMTALARGSHSRGRHEASRSREATASADSGGVWLTGFREKKDRFREQKRGEERRARRGRPRATPARISGEEGAGSAAFPFPCSERPEDERTDGGEEPNFRLC